MLHTKKFNNNEYTIQSEGYENSRSWGHISKLYMNGMYMGKNKEQNGIKRLTKSRREDAMQFAGDRIKELQSLYKTI